LLWGRALLDALRLSDRYSTSEGLAHNALIANPRLFDHLAEARLLRSILESTPADILERGRPTERLFETQVIQGHVGKLGSPAVLDDLAILGAPGVGSKLDATQARGVLLRTSLARSTVSRHERLSARPASA